MSKEEDYIKGWKAGVEFAKNSYDTGFEDGYKKGLKEAKEPRGIVVGDVVINGDEEYVVTRIYSSTFNPISYTLICLDDGCWSVATNKNLTPTGRHITLDFLKNYKSPKI